MGAKYKWFEYPFVGLNIWYYWLFLAACALAAFLVIFGPGILLSCIILVMCAAAGLCGACCCCCCCFKKGKVRPRKIKIKTGDDPVRKPTRNYDAETSIEGKGTITRVSKEQKRQIQQQMYKDPFSV